MAAATRVNLLTPTAADRPILLRIPFSHYCRKVEWAMVSAGIDYETRDIWPWQIRPVYDLHEAGTVPVLHVGDRLLTDSSDILAWIEQQKPGSLYDGHDRHAIEAWESWANEELGPMSRRQAYRVAYHRPGAMAVPRKARIAARLGHPFILKVLKFYKTRRYDESDASASPLALAKVAAGLRESGGPFLLGKQVCAADFTVAALLDPLLWAADGADLGDHPDLQACREYVDRVRPDADRRLRSRRMRKRDWLAWQALS